MRTEIMIHNIDAVSINTKAKLDAGIADVITTVSFQCRVKALDMMRLSSLLKQNASLSASFFSRQAAFDWVEAADGEYIRKVCDSNQPALGLPQNDLIPVPMFSEPDTSTDATEEPIPDTPDVKLTLLCDRCASRGEECIEAEAYTGSVTECTGFKAKDPTGLTAPVETTEPEGNGHSTRYIPNNGKGRRSRKAAA